MDIAIIAVFVYGVRKYQHFRKRNSLEKEIGLFESLVSDSEKMAAQFKVQLEGKHHLIKGLNEKLDKRIAGLSLLLNRADAVLSTYGKDAAGSETGPAVPVAQHAEIFSLAKEGYRPGEIADRLSIPKGEVKLLLDLNSKFSRMRNEEGVS